MAPVVTRTVTVRRPVDDVRALITVPDRVFPVITGFGRFDRVSVSADTAAETWDIFLDVGTLHVGGRARVEVAEGQSLSWASERGTRSTGSLSARALNQDSCEVTMSVTVRFAGILVVKLVDVAAASILGRHLEAALQQLRHYAEHDELPPVFG